MAALIIISSIAKIFFVLTINDNAERIRQAIQNGLRDPKISEKKDLEKPSEFILKLLFPLSLTDNIRCYLWGTNQYLTYQYIKGAFVL